MTKVVTTKGENYAHTSTRLFTTSEAMHKAARAEASDLAILEHAHLLMNEYDMPYKGSEDMGVWILAKAEDERTEIIGQAKEIED